MISGIQSILLWCREPSTGFRDFIGSMVEGNEEFFGPFLGVAPEGTDFPYMVFDVLEADLDQGFNNDQGIEGTSYGEHVPVRWHLYDTDSDRLSDNLTKFVNAMDCIVEFDLEDNQFCKSVTRTKNPRLFPEPVAKGKRVFHAMVTFEYRIARMKGVGA